MRVAVQEVVPARTFEYDEEERPKSRYAGGDYDSVAFNAIGRLVSWVSRMALRTYAFHIHSVTVITNSY